MFYKSMFYKSYVLRICVIRLDFSSIEVSNTPRFTSLRFAQSTFESPRCTSQHFGIVHAFGHKVHVLQRPRFLSSSYVCYIVHVLQIPVLPICVIRFLSSSIEVFNVPCFTSLRLAQFTFESQRFTFPHFGIIHVLDMKFMFCNVHDF